MHSPPLQVSNDPSLSHRYGIKLQDKGEASRALFRPVGRQQSYRSMVHNNVVLTAPDQLRQRVAWALAQVMVL